MKLYDLVRMTVSGTPGTASTINLLAAATGGYLTFAQALVPDGAKVSYGIKDGNNLEVGRATYNSAGPSLSNRAPILVTGGGQSPLSLTSAAVVGIVALSQDFEEELPPLTQLLGTDNSTAAEVESTRALRTSLRAMNSVDPNFTVGRYAVGCDVVWNLTTTALSGHLFWQCGMPYAPGLALVQKLQVQMVTSAISGARNGNCRIDLRQYINVSNNVGTVMFGGYGMTNESSGGNFQGDQNKLRLFGAHNPMMTIWGSSNTGLNQGQSTIIPLFISSLQGGLGQAVGNNIPLTTMFDAQRDGGYNPIVLQARYGLGLEAQVPAAVTSQVVNWAVNLVWDEYIPIVSADVRN